MSGFAQIERHGPAHDAEADESDCCHAEFQRRESGKDKAAIWNRGWMREISRHRRLVGQSPHSRNRFFVYIFLATPRGWN
jgi:hypothetical protein